MAVGVKERDDDSGERRSHRAQNTTTIGVISDGDSRHLGSYQPVTESNRESRAYHYRGLRGVTIALFHTEVCALEGRPLPQHVAGFRIEDQRKVNIYKPNTLNVSQARRLAGEILVTLIQRAQHLKGDSGEDEVYQDTLETVRAIRGFMADIRAGNIKDAIRNHYSGTLEDLTYNLDWERLAVFCGSERDLGELLDLDQDEFDEEVGNSYNRYPDDVYWGLRRLRRRS